jgi:hypothetical protein
VDERSVVATMYEAEQALAADGAVACFSSNLSPLGLNADRAPQLKRSVGQLPENYGGSF